MAGMCRGLTPIFARACLGRLCVTPPDMVCCFLHFRFKLPPAAHDRLLFRLSHPPLQDAPNSSSTWLVSEFTKADPLAKMIITNQYGATDGFFWCHHTFTHENLDNVTRFDADQQIQLNQAIAQAVRVTQAELLTGAWGDAWVR